LWLPADKQKIAPFEQALKEEREKREQRNLLMTEKLRELGIDIKYEEVTRIAGNAVVGRPHFAQLLKEKRVISQEKEAFYRYIGKDCPAYVERRQILPEQGVEILKKSGAVIAFAHPGQLKDCSPEEFEKLVARLKECGLDALEVYHSSHTAANVRYLKETAKKYGLAVTGGSDFHGAHKPNIRLGHVLSGSIKENRIGYDIYARLNEYRLQR
ncbi:MAG: phosphatase, partial [Mailhella sp.]|nr:phosphatase [Mailhella sp.]